MARARVSVAGKPRGGRDRRRIRPGKRAREGRGQAAHLCPTRQAGAEDALLVSSTSAIVASRFTEKLPGRARCLVGHPVNPPHLVPLVELCGAPWTSPEAIDRARAIYREIGQVPVTINREINGFVLNRLQGALLAEAFRLVGEGYISAEDLDHTVKDGLGLRWSFLGPFETIELNAPGGIPGLLRALYRLLQGAGFRPPPALTCIESPNVDRVIAAWPHQPTTGTYRRADASAATSAWRHWPRTRPRKPANPECPSLRQEEQTHEPQSHHHLRRDRRDPHPLDVEGPAGDAAGNRRRRGRRRRSRCRDRASARPQSRRPASPTRARKPSRRS